jgi:hypothetical protein
MLKTILVLSVIISFSQVSYSKSKKKLINIPPTATSPGEDPSAPKKKKKPSDPEPVVPDDKDLVKANKLQRREHFVEAKNLKVVKILPPDTKGLPHQKFVIQLSDTRLVSVVSNLKLCEKIPVEINDIVSVGGEYLPTGKFSGLVHWTHFDPEKKRPHGYIAMGDKLFCAPKQ